MQLDLILDKVKELGDGPPPAYITIEKPIKVGSLEILTGSSTYIRGIR